MRWFTTTVAGLAGLLSTSSLEQDTWAYQARFVAARDAMLDLLEDGTYDQTARLARELRNASDAERLWYLRPELMHVLADLHGERLAGAKLQALTPLFKSLVPEGLLGRPPRF